MLIRVDCTTHTGLILLTERQCPWTSIQKYREDFTPMTRARICCAGAVRLPTGAQPFDDAASHKRLMRQSTKLRMQSSAADLGCFAFG
jgi:hypothetical protein